ncbi:MULTISPECIES: hypothetical protein [Empedobacter]|uniref:Uncharacterized protein n=1 Tax=Empedobacter falsenii TaxID=343874 RepID=A0A7H9DTP9_9FLAO|nr:MULTISPECIES: hypothetical protein [Empedobacter]MDH2208107.1 hypothetical protein [Empedobacter sp. GD03644]QLL58582.1 hypothetical protein FH779_10980 [Empedobacter falsenii]
MKKRHPIFGLFFSIILFSIPIFNQLHFSLIDHSQDFSNQKKEIIHHQCNHFTFYSVFIDTHDDPKIEGKLNEEFYRKESFEQVEKIKLSTIEYRFTRGPPQDFVYS